MRGSGTSGARLPWDGSVVNSTLLAWCLVEEGHRDVDAGQGTLLLGIVRLVAHLMRARKRYRNIVRQGGTVECQIVP